MEKKQVKTKAKMTPQQVEKRKQTTLANAAKKVMFQPYS